MSAPTKDPEIGAQYGRFTVVGQAESRGRYKYIPVKCECGTTKEVEKSNLLSGRVKSCGCLNSEASRIRNTRHGLKSNRVYSIWNMMRQRCTLPSNAQFENYGGRGIKVCDEWSIFENFIQDMGLPPFEGATLERVNTNGDYCKQNCVWATPKDQARNRRSNVRLTISGKTRVLIEWAEELNVNYAKLRYRVAQGWDGKMVMENLDVLR